LPSVTQRARRDRRVLPGVQPNDIDVALMSLLRHECGIDVVRPGPEASIATDVWLLAELVGLRR